MIEDEMLQRLEQSRESSKNGNYRNADDVISDIREKNKQAAKNVLDDFEDTVNC